MPVSNPPFLTADEFKYACTTLERLASKLQLDIEKSNNAPLITLITFPHGSLLRIERHVPSQGEGPEADFNDDDGHLDTLLDNDNGEEDDDDTIHPHDLSRDEDSLGTSLDIVKVVYDICLSPSWNVPVLYIDLVQPGPPTTGRLDKLYELLVAPDAKQKLKSTSVMGGLTMTDHAMTGLPCFFIHPCETINHLQSVLKHDPIDVLRYMVIWLSYAGPPVGLHLPKELAILAFSGEKGEMKLP